MQDNKNQQLTLSTSVALVVQEKIELISELLRYLREIESKTNELQKVQGSTRYPGVTFYENYEEGQYLNSLGGLNRAYTAILKVFSDAMQPLVPQSIFKKGNKGVRQPYIQDLLRGISLNLGFWNFIPSWTIYREIMKYEMSEQEKATYEKAFPILGGQYQWGNSLPERYGDFEHPLTAEEWQILRELCSIHVYDQVVIACHQDDINHYLSSLRSGYGRGWGIQDRELLRHLQRYDCYLELMGYAYTPYFDKSLPIEEEVTRIVQGEEARFRLFTEAFYATLTALAALARHEPLRQGFDVQMAIVALADMVKKAQEEQERKRREAEQEKEEAVTEEETIIESDLNEEPAIYDTDAIYSYEMPVAPLIDRSTPTILGYEVVDGAKTDRQVTVEDIARRSGCYIVGVAGTGKSSELEAMIWQDICKGYPVIVFDPHGQLLDNIIARMPEQFLQKTYLLDLADTTHMFGLNIFACEDIEDEQERDKTYGSIKVAFSKLFPEADKKLFGTTLRHVAHTMIENPDMTLQDIPRFIQDEGYREEKIKDLRQGQTKRYWQQTFSKKAPSKQQTETDPFLNRVDELLSSNTIRRALCQPHTTIDFRRVIERKQIILIRLPVEDEYAEAAGIIGTILLSKIAAATFSFSDIAREEDRPGFSFYVDEFQNFESVDMARLYTQARKYGARLCLAHQTRKGQLTLEAVEAATISASTKLFFRTIADDSRDLARSISDLQLKTRPDHIPHEVLKLLPYHENSQVKAFSNLIVVPLQRWQGKEEDLVEQAGLFHWYQDTEKNIFGWARRQFKEGLHEIEVFLRDAMVHQQVDLSKLEYLMNIFAVRLGYPNYYLHSFLEVPRTKKTWVRVDDEEIHYHHVAPTEDETAKEKAEYDMVRAVLITVANILIAEPVGEKRETTQDERADFLSNLPKRTAVAKIESTTIVMQTRDLNELAKAVSDTERDRRKAQIIQRTHAKYCKTNEEIDELAYEEDEASEPIQNDILRSNPTLATLAQIRHDIEKLIKALYAKYTPTDAKSTRPGLRAMVQSLRKQGILESSLTITLQEIIEIANHVIHGETVKPEQATHAIELSGDAIAALNRILQPSEANSTWNRFEPLE